MTDERITTGPPPGPSGPPTVLPIPSALPAPPGPRWLPNLLLLLALSLPAALVPGYLVTQGAFTAARVVFVVLAAVGLVLAWRPLFVRGRRKFLRAFAFTGVLLAFLVGSGLATYFLFYRGFVIPTGSMAPTTRGYHLEVACPQCGQEFAVNASAQLDPENPAPAVVTACACPNCLAVVSLGDKDREVAAGTGDRILVARFLGGPSKENLARFDIVTFHYPNHPPNDPREKIYVNRLVGLPGETVAIHHGRLFRSTELVHDGRDIAPEDLRLPQHMHAGDPKALDLFRQGKFEILRRPLDTLLTLRHLVHDNDLPARDLAGVLPPRWGAAEGAKWAPGDRNGFRHDGSGAQAEWLRYRHVLRPADWPLAKVNDPEGRLLLEDQESRRRIAEIARRTHRPQLMTDYVAYNNFTLNLGAPRGYEPQNWVGDLMLETTLTVEKAAGEFCLELSKGVDRFRASLDLASGNCTLYRLGADGKLQELDRKATVVRQAGEYRLRFANIDRRLTLWVGEELPFGDGVVYDAPKEPGPTRNDLEPASLASKGAAVRVAGLRLWRDAYWTLEAGGTPDHTLGDPENRFALPVVDWSDPKTWEPLRNLRPRIFRVHPGHYFVLGDNSPQSSDSRDWGLVPEHLLVGRALLIYGPWARAGVLR